MHADTKQDSGFLRQVAAGNYPLAAAVLLGYAVVNLAAGLMSVNLPSAPAEGVAFKVGILLGVIVALAWPFIYWTYLALSTLTLLGWQGHFVEGKQISTLVGFSFVVPLLVQIAGLILGSMDVTVGHYVFLTGWACAAAVVVACLHDYFDVPVADAVIAVAVPYLLLPLALLYLIAF